MNDEKRAIEMQKERDDKALRDLMEEYAEAEGRALEEAVKAQNIPEEALDQLDKHVEALLRASDEQQKKLLFRRQSLQTAKRAAGFALVFLFLASTVIMSVSALRIPFMNLFLDSKSRYTTVSFGTPPEENAETDLIAWILSKILPDGYSLVDQLIDEDAMIHLLFQNDEHSILRVIVRFSNSILNVDTEDVEPITVDLNGHDAIYLQKKGHRIIWTDEKKGIVLEVYADGLSKAEFWKYVYQLAE